MLEIVPELSKWIDKHEKIALATVTQTWGSSPRGIGAVMAFTKKGQLAGSVSGGCVEGAVVETGLEVLNTKQPRLVHFGVADETAWDVGLACGGQIDVFVNRFSDEFFPYIQKELELGRPFCVATVVSGPKNFLGKEILVAKDYTNPPEVSSPLEKSIITYAQTALAENQTQIKKMETGDKELVELFLNIIEPQPTLIIVGGVHIAVALTQIASAVGYRTVLIDPRRTFGNEERFPGTDRLLQTWPDEAFKLLQVGERTAIAILTHDPKIDDPALQIALQSSAFYVGALGSASTQEKRRQRLQQAGISEEQLSHLHGPIGLNLGSQTPEEVALAVMAEIVAVRHKVSV